MDQQKKNFFILLTLVLTCIFCLGAAEIFIRIVRPQNTYSRLLAILKTGLYMPGDFNPFTLKPNVITESPSMEYPGKIVKITTNSLGFRGAEIKPRKDKNDKRILILGDSYTYGVFVPDNETFCARLQDLFQKNNKSVEVINAGYADGWAPDEHYSWLVNKGISFEPDIVVYAFFIGNDLGNDELVWEKTDAEGLPTKVNNPNIYVDGDGMLRSRAEDEKTVGVEGIYKIPILRDSHLAIFIYSRFNRFMAKFEKEDNTNHKGWGADPFPFILKAASDEKMKKQEEKFKKLVFGLKQASNNHKSKFLLMMIPVNFQVEEAFLPQIVSSNDYKIQRNFFDELKPWLKENNIEYLDLLEAMKRIPGKYYPKNGEVHFNPQGHQFTAEQIKQTIDQLHWL